MALDERPGTPPSEDGTTLDINSDLMAEERALLNSEGLPGRPWFRHQIYAPLPSYDAETLPGLREALEAKNVEAAREQAQHLGHSLDMARDLLRAAIGRLK
jgi:N-acetylated-alpha-linked acidic dipeptidase